MSGNSVQIFSIGITVTALMQPIKAIIGSAQDKDVDIFLPRLAFIALQLGGQYLFAFVMLHQYTLVVWWAERPSLSRLLGLAMGLYKLSNMGLLPTHGSDWIEGKVPEVRMIGCKAGGTSLYLPPH
eukprot:1189244-Prorocentrum_minimum.AAC.1